MRVPPNLWLLLGCLDLAACLSPEGSRKPRMRRLTARIASKFLRAIGETRAETRAASATNATNGNGAPHILYIVADDLGWNDVGYHNERMKTPNIDALAGEGIKLESFYTPPVCSATRASLLTGRYTHHIGFQHFNPPKAIGGVGAVPQKEKLLPQYLKDKGYATHIVGKWHGGMIKEEYLPHNRGFDSHFGFYEGGIDYYKHTIAGKLDFHFAEAGKKAHCIRQFAKTDTNKGVYDLDLFTRRSVKLIDEHKTDKPLFLYLAYHSPHTPNACPQPYYDMYPEETDEWRRVFCGMVTAMDVAVGITAKKFKEKFGKNYIILFHSDNGGPTYLKGGAENWPLRGGKLSLYEGGQRVIAFVNSPMIPSTGTERKGLIHATDALPTLAQLGDNEIQKHKLDGFNLWPWLTGAESKEGPRHEIIHGIDPLGNADLGEFGPEHVGCKTSGEFLGKDGECQISAAIRQGPWKLIVGMYAQCMASTDLKRSRACGRFQHSKGDLVDQMEAVDAANMGKISDFGTEGLLEGFAGKFGDSAGQVHVALFNIHEDPNELDNVVKAVGNHKHVHKMLKRILDERNKETWVDPQWPPYKTCDAPGGSCDYRPDWYLDAEKQAGCAGPFVPCLGQDPITGFKFAGAARAQSLSLNFTLPPEVRELLDDFME